MRQHARILWPAVAMVAAMIAGRTPAADEAPVPVAIAAFDNDDSAGEAPAAARATGARLLVCGGVHKMSTLVQWGKLHVVDLAADRLLLDRNFSFRGDSDEAFRRAAEFVARYVKEVVPLQ